MKIHAPSAKMTIVTKCERIQPFVSGTDEKGELVWEGRMMPRWQMEMHRLAVDICKALFSQWVSLAKHVSDRKETDGTDFVTDARLPMFEERKSREAIQEKKRAYHARKAYWNRVSGD
jgi:hypothetical protein